MSKDNEALVKVGACLVYLEQAQNFTKRRSNNEELLMTPELKEMYDENIINAHLKLSSYYSELVLSGMNSRLWCSLKLNTRKVFYERLTMAFVRKACLNPYRCS